MSEKQVIWQIGKPYTGNAAQTISEFRRAPVAVPVFNYNVDADARASTHPDCPGVLHMAGKPPDQKSLNIAGTSTAKLNIHFTLDANYKAGELALIYDRFGSDVDHIHFDGELLAVQTGAGEGKLKRFRHVFGKVAKGKHTLTLTTHGGIGNCHNIDFLKLTANPAEVKVQPPEIEICTIHTIDPGKPGGGDEYVELINNGSGAANLSGWYVHADVCDVRFIFPEGTILQPGKLIRVYTNRVDIATGGFSFKIDHAIWSVTGDIGTLFDKDGNLISGYAFGSKKPLVNGGDAGGSGGGSAGGGGASGGGGLSGVIDTSAVLAAALEHLNRQSVLAVLQQIAQEIDEHCSRFPGIDEEILKLRNDLTVRIDALSVSIDKYQVSIGDINVALASLKTQYGDYFANFDVRVGGIVQNNLAIRLPDIIQEIRSSLDVTIQQKIENVVVKTDVQALLLKIEEMSAKIELLKKAANELDVGELKQVEILLQQVLQNIDLSPILAHINITVNGGSYRLDELVAILAGGDKVAAIHFTYNVGDIGGARFVLVDGVEVTFVCGRRDLPQTSEVEYVFQTSNWKGLPASFTLRFRKQTTQLGMCKKSLALDSYAVVFQSNVVFNLAKGR